MDLHSPRTDLVVIFDAERNAYEAAVSEGWPVSQERGRATRRPAEPFSAFVMCAAYDAARERAAA